MAAACLETEALPAAAKDEVDLAPKACPAEVEAPEELLNPELPEEADDAGAELDVPVDFPVELLKPLLPVEDDEGEEEEDLDELENPEEEDLLELLELLELVDLARVATGSRPWATTRPRKTARRTGQRNRFMFSPSLHRRLGEVECRGLGNFPAWRQPRRCQA